MSFIPKKWKAAIFNWLSDSAVKIDHEVAVPVVGDGMDATYLMDFRNDRFGSSVTGNSGIIYGDAITMTQVSGGLASEGEVPKGHVRAEVSPKSVVEELKRSPTMMSLDGIDGDRKSVV